MNNKYEYRFSVFTATFNRGKKLYNVYEDLLSQTYKDFEWVIVNDGSSDDTDEIAKAIIAENKLKIQYIKKPNGGKHTAWKVATDIFRGKYVVGADDDDRITPDFLEVFNRHWSNIEKNNEYDQFWEVRARCIYENGNLMGKKLPEPWYDSDYNSINYKDKFYGKEMVGCRKIEVLKEEASVPDTFIFDDKVSNFPEVIRWSRAARKYKTRFSPEVVRIYYSSAGGLSSGNKSNSGPNRNMRTTYNTLVGQYYTLLEQRDLMLKYSLKSYARNLIGLAYASLCTKEKIPTTGFLKLEKILFPIIKGLIYPLYLIRK